MRDRYERVIRRTLRKLARQRVRVILQPGNVIVVDQAVEEDEETAPALMTCYLRGWVEPLEHAIPSGRLTPDGNLPNPLFSGVKTMYRMTDAGWSVVYRVHLWLVMTVIIAFLSLFAGVLVGIFGPIISSHLTGKGAN